MEGGKMRGAGRAESVVPQPPRRRVTLFLRDSWCMLAVTECAIEAKRMVARIWLAPGSTTGDAIHPRCLGHSPFRTRSASHWCWHWIWQLTAPCSACSALATRFLSPEIVRCARAIALPVMGSIIMKPHSRIQFVYGAE